MRKGMLFAIVPGMLVFLVGFFVLVLLITKLLWAWTIPDLFPGAVDKGLVAGEISWYTALKLAIIAAILGGGLRGHIRREA